MKNMKKLRSTEVMKLSLRLVVKITRLVIKPMPLGGDQVLRAEPSGIGYYSYRDPREPPKGLHREPPMQNCSLGELLA